MLVIRLKRIGKKNKPTYRVVVAEHTCAVAGSYVEDLGFYNPHSKQFSIDKVAVGDWLNKGAKPSNTVARLLEKEKVKHKSIVVIKYNKAPKKKVEEKPLADTKPDASKAEETSEEEVIESTDPPAEVIAPEGAIIEEASVIEEPAPTEDDKSAESVEETAKTTEQPAA